MCCGECSRERDLPWVSQFLEDLFKWVAQWLELHPLCKHFFPYVSWGRSEMGLGKSLAILIPFGTHLVQCPHYKPGEISAQKGTVAVPKALASRGDCIQTFWSVLFSLQSMIFPKSSETRWAKVLMAASQRNSCVALGNHISLFPLQFLHWRNRPYNIWLPGPPWVMLRGKSTCNVPWKLPVT